jgi:hypothetical protein
MASRYTQKLRLSQKVKLKNKKKKKNEHHNFIKSLLAKTKVTAQSGKMVVGQSSYGGYRQQHSQFQMRRSGKQAK